MYGWIIVLGVIATLVVVIWLLARWVNPVRWLRTVTPTPVAYAKDGMRVKRPIANESRAVRFFVDDGSGRALVQAPVERMNLVLSREGEADGWIAQEPAASLIQRLRSEFGIDPAFRDNIGFIRFKEAAAEVGSRISVAGWCRWSQDASGTRTLLLEPRDGSGLELIVCDHPDVVSVNPKNPAPGYRMAG